MYSLHHDLEYNPCDKQTLKMFFKHGRRASYLYLIMRTQKIKLFNSNDTLSQNDMNDGYLYVTASLDFIKYTSILFNSKINKTKH